jgi:Protein of unknown function, DUF481
LPSFNPHSIWEDKGFSDMPSSQCLSRCSAQFCRFVPAVLALLTFSSLLALPSHGSNLGEGAGQANATAAPDILVLSNGDQITGKLLRAVNGTVTFHSEILGDLNVTWDKIRSIRSSQSFAVIQEGQKITRKTPNSEVGLGTVQVENQQVEMSAAPNAVAKVIPTKNTQYLIDAETYTKQVHGSLGLREGWTGAVTFGASQVQATQNSRTFTTAVSAVRPVPNVVWLPPRTRIELNFNSAYGSLSQPNQPTTKTNIIHGDVQYDWYLTPRFFALVTARFDHNYSQGLDLQQSYGAGFGYTLIKTPKQELDLKTDVHYEKQTFGNTPGVFPPVVTPSKNLIGADFGDTYLLHLPHGMIFNQGLAVTPAFNQTNAWSAIATAGLAFPVYKHFSFSLGALDNYLNDPAIGSKKNSFQYTAGLTYTFQ